MTESDQTKQSRTKFSSRVEPFWLNPATIKGTVAIGAGATILTFPDATLFVIRAVLGVALVITGLADLWFHLRGANRGNRVRDLAEGLLTIAVGLFFIAFPAETLKTVMLIAGVYLAMRGISGYFLSPSLVSWWCSRRRWSLDWSPPSRGRRLCSAG